MSLIFKSLGAAPHWGLWPAEIPMTRRSSATTSAYHSRVPLTKQLYPQNRPATLLFSECHEQQQDRSSPVGSTLRAPGARPCPTGGACGWRRAAMTLPPHSPSRGQALLFQVPDPWG